MVRGARWAEASASINNRTNISVDLPDNLYPKRPPVRGTGEGGRTWIGFWWGDDRRRERKFTDRAKKQDVREGKNPTFHTKSPANTVQIPRQVVLQFNTHAHGGLIAIAHARQGLRVNRVRPGTTRLHVPPARSRAEPVSQAP